MRVINSKQPGERIDSDIVNPKHFLSQRQIVIDTGREPAKAQQDALAATVLQLSFVTKFFNLVKNLVS